jgi:glycosyltransferase involved in cell wall biosynthesis
VDRIEGKKRLRIVQAIFTNGFAGSERIAIELCNALAERHDVLLLVADDCDQHPDHSILAHVSPNVAIRKIRHGFRPLRVALAAWRFKADLFHAHLGRAVNDARFMPPGICRVATWHMDRPVKARWLDGVVLIAEWQVSLLSENRVPASVVVRNWVPDFPKPAPEKLAALRASFGIGPDDFVVGFVGRPDRKKGIEEAILGFALWKHPGTHMLVVGGTQNGETYPPDNLRRPNIKITGFRTDIRDLYSIFDCMVAPSYAEPFGLAVIEAMRAGCRVIVRDTCGLRDIAAANPDVMTIADSDPALICDALERAYTLRDVPPKYDMSLYDKDARVAEVEAFYGALMG